MTSNLHDLRIGDLVLREMDVEGEVAHHVGEVLSIRARVRYVGVDYRWAEWWDVTTGTLWPFKAGDVPGYRLRRVSVDEVNRLGLR